MRKHLAASIDELESIFRNHLSDQSVLREISNELAYRRTDRAARLRTQVAEQLTNLDHQARRGQETNQPKPARGPKSGPTSGPTAKFSYTVPQAGQPASGSRATGITAGSTHQSS